MFEPLNEEQQLNQFAVSNILGKEKEAKDKAKRDIEQKQKEINNILKDYNESESNKRLTKLSDYAITFAILALLLCLITGPAGLGLIAGKLAGKIALCSFYTLVSGVALQGLCEFKKWFNTKDSIEPINQQIKEIRDNLEEHLFELGNLKDQALFEINDKLNGLNIPNYRAMDGQLLQDNNMFPLQNMQSQQSIPMEMQQALENLKQYTESLKEAQQKPIQVHKGVETASEQPIKSQTVLQDEQNQPEQPIKSQTVLQDEQNQPEQPIKAHIIVKDPEKEALLQELKEMKKQLKEKDRQLERAQRRNKGFDDEFNSNQDTNYLSHQEGNIPNRSQPQGNIPNRSQPQGNIPNRSQPQGNIPNRSQPTITDRAKKMVAAIFTSNKLKDILNKEIEENPKSAKMILNSCNTLYYDKDKLMYFHEDDIKNFEDIKKIFESIERDEVPKSSKNLEKEKEQKQKLIDDEIVRIKKQVATKAPGKNIDFNKFAVKIDNWYKEAERNGIDGLNKFLETLQSIDDKKHVSINNFLDSIFALETDLKFGDLGGKIKEIKEKDIYEHVDALMNNNSLDYKERINQKIELLKDLGVKDNLIKKLKDVAVGLAEGSKQQKNFNTFLYNLFAAHKRGLSLDNFLLNNNLNDFKVLNNELVNLVKSKDPNSNGHGDNKKENQENIRLERLKRIEMEEKKKKEEEKKKIEELYKNIKERQKKYEDFIKEQKEGKNDFSSVANNMVAKTLAKKVALMGKIPELNRIFNIYENFLTSGSPGVNDYEKFNKFLDNVLNAHERGILLKDFLEEHKKGNFNDVNKLVEEKIEEDKKKKEEVREKEKVDIQDTINRINLKLDQLNDHFIEKKQSNIATNLTEIVNELLDNGKEDLEVLRNIDNFLKSVASNKESVIVKNILSTLKSGINVKEATKRIESEVPAEKDTLKQSIKNETDGLIAKLQSDKKAVVFNGVKQLLDNEKTNFSILKKLDNFLKRAKKEKDTVLNNVFADDKFDLSDCDKKLNDLKSMERLRNWEQRSVNEKYDNKHKIEEKNEEKGFKSAVNSTLMHLYLDDEDKKDRKEKKAEKEKKKSDQAKFNIKKNQIVKKVLNDERLKKIINANKSYENVINKVIGSVKNEEDLKLLQDLLKQPDTNIISYCQTVIDSDRSINSDLLGDLKKALEGFKKEKERQNGRQNLLTSYQQLVNAMIKENVNVGGVALVGDISENKEKSTLLQKINGVLLPLIRSDIDEDKEKCDKILKQLARLSEQMQKYDFIDCNKLFDVTKLEELEQKIENLNLRISEERVNNICKKMIVDNSNIDEKDKYDLTENFLTAINQGYKSNKQDAENILNQLEQLSNKNIQEQSSISFNELFGSDGIIDLGNKVEKFALIIDIENKMASFDRDTLGKIKENFPFFNLDGKVDDIDVYRNLKKALDNLLKFQEGNVDFMKDIESIANSIKQGNDADILGLINRFNVKITFLLKQQKEKLDKKEENKNDEEEKKEENKNDEEEKKEENKNDEEEKKEEKDDKKKNDISFKDEEFSEDKSLSVSIEKTKDYHSVKVNYKSPIKDEIGEIKEKYSFNKGTEYIDKKKEKEGEHGGLFSFFKKLLNKDSKESNSKSTKKDDNILINEENKQEDNLNEQSNDNVNTYGNSNIKNDEEDKKEENKNDEEEKKEENKNDEEEKKESEKIWNDICDVFAEENLQGKEKKYSEGVQNNIIDPLKKIFQNFDIKDKIALREFFVKSSNDKFDRLIFNRLVKEFLRFDNIDTQKVFNINDIILITQEAMDRLVKKVDEEAEKHKNDTPDGNNLENNKVEKETNVENYGNNKNDEEEKKEEKDDKKKNDISFKDEEFSEDKSLSVSIEKTKDYHSVKVNYKSPIKDEIGEIKEKYSFNKGTEYIDKKKEKEAEKHNNDTPDGNNLENNKVEKETNVENYGNNTNEEEKSVKDDIKPKDEEEKKEEIVNKDKDSNQNIENQSNDNVNTYGNSNIKNDEEEKKEENKNEEEDKQEDKKEDLNNYIEGKLNDLVEEEIKKLIKNCYLEVKEENLEAFKKEIDVFANVLSELKKLDNNFNLLNHFDKNGIKIGDNSVSNNNFFSEDRDSLKLMTEIATMIVKDRNIIDEIDKKEFENLKEFVNQIKQATKAKQEMRTEMEKLYQKFKDNNNKIKDDEKKASFTYDEDNIQSKGDLESALFELKEKVENQQKQIQEQQKEELLNIATGRDGLKEVIQGLLKKEEQNSVDFSEKTIFDAIKGNIEEICKKYQDCVDLDILPEELNKLIKQSDTFQAVVEVLEKEFTKKQQEQINELMNNISISKYVDNRNKISSMRLDKSKDNNSQIQQLEKENKEIDQNLSNSLSTIAKNINITSQISGNLKGYIDKTFKDSGKSFFQRWLSVAEKEDEQLSDLGKKNIKGLIKIINNTLRAIKNNQSNNDVCDMFVTSFAKNVNNSKDPNIKAYNANVNKENLKSGLLDIIKNSKSKQQPVKIIHTENIGNNKPNSEKILKDRLEMKREEGSTKREKENKNIKNTDVVLEPEANDIEINNINVNKGNTEIINVEKNIQLEQETNNNINIDALKNDKEKYSQHDSKKTVITAVFSSSTINLDNDFNEIKFAENINVENNNKSNKKENNDNEEEKDDNKIKTEEPSKSSLIITNIGKTNNMTQSNINVGNNTQNQNNSIQVN